MKFLNLISLNNRVDQTLNNETNKTNQAKRLQVVV